MPEDGLSGRVATVHAEARRTLAVSVTFVFAAVAAAIVPHHTGRWLPLHLFLVGALLLAISGATQLFAVTWAAGRPGNPRLVALQRHAVAAGAAGLAVAREFPLPTAAVAVAGACVAAGLALLAGLLVGEVRSGVQRRFDAALHGYLAGLGVGLAGVAAGVALAFGHTGLRDTHLILNLLGLVGLVVAATLPFFVAAEARVKPSRRVTSARLHAVVVWLAGSVVAAALASTTGRRLLEAAALGSYAGGLVYLTGLLPRVRAKQLRWAGPRLIQLGAGVGWWFGAVVVAAGRVLMGDAPFPGGVLFALVVGGYAQILVASLAYLGPVVIGGGHRRLAAGFSATASWLGLVAANVSATALSLQLYRVGILAMLVWAADTLRRTARLRAPNP